MDILLFVVYAAVCGIIVYWRIIRPWNATRHVRFFDLPASSDIDVPHKVTPVYGFARKSREHDTPRKPTGQDRDASVGDKCGTMALDLEFGGGFGRHARLGSEDFLTVPIGQLQGWLQEIQSFCSTPRAKAEIEGRFPGVEVSSLRNLGILSEAGEFGRVSGFIWSGLKPDFPSRQDEKFGGTVPQMKDPIFPRFESLIRQVKGDINFKGGCKDK